MICKFCNMTFYAPVLRTHCERENCIEKSIRVAKLTVILETQGSQDVLIKVTRGNELRKYRIKIMNGLWTLYENREETRKDIKMWPDCYSANTIITIALHYILQVDFPTS